MKKLLLLFSIFILTGCYDYKELNELSIVSMIIIDKEDNNYQVTFEVLNDQKDSDNISLIVSSSGNSIASAINNASSKTPKEAYFAHLKVLAISKDVAKSNLKEISEYFLRAPHIRNEFYLTIVDNHKANEITSLLSKQTPIISDYISLMLKNNNKTVNNVTSNNYEDILIDIFEKGKDATIPVIKVKDNLIQAYGNALLHKYELKAILDIKDSKLLNILNNNASNTLFTYSCPNNKGNIALSIYSGKTKKKIYDNKLIININLMAEIEEYNCSNDLKNTNTFKVYNQYYANVIKQDVISLYQLMQEKQTDVLGIGKLLYIKNRYYKDNNWLNLDYEVNVDLKINKEGLIFEVTNGN